MLQINLPLLTELEAQKKQVHQAIKNELERVYPPYSTVYVFLSSKQKKPSEAEVGDGDYTYFANGEIRVRLVNARKHYTMRDVHFTNIQKNSKERS